MIRGTSLLNQGLKLRYPLPYQFSGGQYISYPYTCQKVMYEFSKKGAKKVEAPKVKAKTQLDYAVGPEKVKKHYVQIQNMQTTSQENLQEESLKQVIITQRSCLQKSFTREHAMFLEGKTEEAPVSSSRKGKKIISDQEILELADKYYMHRPLKHLQNIFVNTFAFNLIGVSLMELFEFYNYLGWFYGLVICPVASSSLALLLGYNLAFWIVRQSFSLHIPTPQIKNSSISMISTTYRNLAELSFLAIQGGALMYVTFFPMTFPVYKAYLVLGTTNFLSLYMSLKMTCSSTNIPLRNYIQSYVKLISTASLLLLLFAFYEIQFKAAKTPELTYDSESYRKRLAELDEGYKQFQKCLTAQNFVMKEDQKINAFDAE